MRYLSPLSQAKRRLLDRRRLRRHCSRARWRRNGVDPARTTYFSRKRRPVVDAKLFERSVAGVARWPVLPSYRTDNHGRSIACLRLQAPVDFRFSSNPGEILEYIYELRCQVFIKDRFRSRGTKNRPGLYIDLDLIEHIDIEGALMLAAELDRIRRVLAMRPVLDDANWAPAVRFILRGLGLYGVIEADRYADTPPIGDFDEMAREVGLSVVPFLSCTRADPGKALELRTALYERCAPPGDVSQMAVYEGLVEAFNNAVTHAYRDDCPGDGLPRIRRWWAGAMIDHAEGYLYLVVYDLGVGIPATLEARDFWNLLVGRLPELNDAAVIAGALEYGRSGASQDALLGSIADGRGNGLWRMCELADTFDDADVRFTSLKGDVLYVKGGALKRTTLPTRFCGTMIRWRTKISAARS